MGYKSRGNFQVNADICKKCKKIGKYCICNNKIKNKNAKK